MMTLDFRNWKKVYGLFQGNIPKTALKRYCLQHKSFEGMKERTWGNHCVYDNFTPVQKEAIWEYLKMYHPDEMQQALALQNHKSLQEVA